MGLAGLSLPVVIASTSASADASLDPTVATTGTSIVAQETCTWYMLGAPSAINLLPTAVGGVLPEYEGSPITVSAAFAGETDLNVFSSGAADYRGRDGFTPCTFYSTPTIPMVTVSITDSAFVASAGIYEDSGMSFWPDGASKLMVDTESACGEVWDVAPRADLGIADLSFELMQMLDVDEVDDRVDVEGIVTNRCAADLNINTIIPGGKTPGFAGQTYSWSGPTFTTALSVSDESVDVDGELPPMPPD